MRSTAVARKFKVLFLLLHGWISRPLCQVKEANGKGPSDSSWRLQEDCMCDVSLGGGEQ